MKGRGIAVVAMALLMIMVGVPAGRAGAPDGEPAGPPEEAADPARAGNAGAAGPLVVRGFIDVIAELPRVPAITTIGVEALQSGRPIGGGAEILRGVAGLSLGRMGGHGLEPTVRGLAQTNLNVLVDGVYVHGGCPNRMDPPTSFATAESYDEVVVIRGVQTLRYGGGGVGGTVLYQRHAPMLGDEFNWKAGAMVGASTVLDGPDASVDATVGTDRWSLRLLGGHRDQDDYQDGDGNEVRSAFTSSSGAVLAGLALSNAARLEASYERMRTDDALFAGAGMDAPFDRTSIWRFRLLGDPVDGEALRWSATVYHDTVDHLMDNYSLRELAAPAAMRVPTSSDTSGGRAMAEWELSAWRVSVGGDWQLNRRDATRFAGPNPDMVQTVQSIMWPDVKIENAGVFSEATVDLAERVRLTGGVRVDRWDAEARDADEPTMGGAGPSPRMLWSLYYPEVESSWQDTTVGGLVRLDWSMRRGTLFAGLSHTARAADATERFLGANSPTPTMRWLGNPTLAPAVHNQLEIGYDWSGPGAAFQGSLFADRVGGFILRDRAHGQPDVLRDDGALVYRNVDAERLGGELSGRVELAPRLALDGSLSYVRVENTTDDRPVAQVPPLEGRVALAWRDDRWSAGGAVRAAAKQTRVDADPTAGSGLDTGETPAWAVLDLSGSLRLGLGLDLLVGVDNLFDETYATHLNLASVFDPVPAQVNEPGRVVWARLRWSGGA